MGDEGDLNLMVNGGVRLPVEGISELGAKPRGFMLPRIRIDVQAAIVFVNRPAAPVTSDEFKGDRVHYFPSHLSLNRAICSGVSVSMPRSRASWMIPSIQVQAGWGHLISSFLR